MKTLNVKNRYFQIILVIGGNRGRANSDTYTGGICRVYYRNLEERQWRHFKHTGNIHAKSIKHSTVEFSLCYPMSRHFGPSVISAAAMTSTSVQCHSYHPTEASGTSWKFWRPLSLFTNTVWKCWVVTTKSILQPVDKWRSLLPFWQFWTYCGYLRGFRNEALLPISGTSITYPNKNTLSLYSCPSSLLSYKITQINSLPPSLCLRLCF